MSNPTFSPSLAPSFDTAVHLVLNDFGKLGRSYIEADEEQCDFESVVGSFLQGQYSNPIRVIAFNTAEKWSRDVSEDVAWEVLRRAHARNTVLPEGTHNFCVFHIGEREVLSYQNALL